jgi:hypothetical protein
MKPHPRIRKTIKWGGAAVTVLLVVVWVGSIWWDVAWCSKRIGFVDVGAGGIGFLYHQPSKSDSSIAGWRFDDVADDASMRWWFNVTAVNSWATWCSITIPLWCPFGIIAVACGLAWRLDTLARRRAKLNPCAKCGYDLTGLLKDAKCPECGATPAGV